jgi:TfoX/Sxy family transcriptional regulator of competence genes
VSTWQKSPPDLVERFDSFVGRFPDVERRKMFGYPALFVEGNLATGLYQDRWMIRLPPDELARLITLPGAAPFEPMPGRTMTGYAMLPDDVVADDAALERWVRRAIDHAATLPRKATKAATK